MGQRGRPRDLYDIVNLFRRNDLRLYPDAIRQTLAEKCASKGIKVPTANDFVGSPLLAELESEWENMLGHQLPALPPLAGFLEELPSLFGWLEGTVEFDELPAIAYRADEDEAWSPPPTVATWGAGVPLEAVRFAATNHLLVNLTYQGSQRLIEPYSLRRTRASRLMLHAERADGSGHRSYGVDEIQAIAVTTTPFRPRFPIEFSTEGPLHAPLQSRSASAGFGRPTTRLRSPRREVRYIYRCVSCGRDFPHSRRDPTLRPHKGRQRLSVPRSARVTRRHCLLILGNHWPLTTPTPSPCGTAVESSSRSRRPRG